MAPKKWHDDGRCGNNCMTFEQSIKYVYNASNKQYASLPVGQGARRAGGSRGDRRGRGAQGGEEDHVEVLHEGHLSAK
jgi:hypothetical protein